MDTNRLKRFATEARNSLMMGVAHRLTALGFQPDGSVTDEPQEVAGGAVFMGDTVTSDFYNKWTSLRRAINERTINEVVEEAAYTWFNRLMAIRIMVRNELISPVLEFEGEGVRIPLIVSEAREGRLPAGIDEDSRAKLLALLDDDSRTNEQFALLIVAYCHSNPVINSCFGHISDYTELLLPANILAEGGFVSMLNDTPFISEEDYRSPELIGWLYQFYISEKKDDVFASFKKGKKAEAKDIPAATQIFTPNWIVKYMVQNTVGRIYLDNNPYSDIKDSMQYLVEPEEPTPDDAIFHFDDIHDLTCADLACGSGHILNECFDLLYQLYIEEGYSRKNAIEDIFKYNLTGVDLDTRAKQLAQFALLLKACQKDASFADAHCMPKVLDMPKVDRYTFKDINGHFDCAYKLGKEESVYKELVEAFTLLEQAENLGSIMKFVISDATYNYMLECVDVYQREPKHDEHFALLVDGYTLILTLTQKYAALVMNPPYMGSNNMNSVLSQYVKTHYAISKFDLMTVFMEMGLAMLQNDGKMGMINLPSWLFLSNFELLRKYIVENKSIESLLHMGRGIFGIDWGSVAFVVSNVNIKREGYYFRLHERNFQHIYYYHIKELFLQALNNREFKYDFGRYRGEDSQDLDCIEFAHCPNGTQIFYAAMQKDFASIPGTPIGYWINQELFKTFDKNILVGERFNVKTGFTTGNKDKYTRFWFEISNNTIRFNATSQEDFSHFKWFPLTSGGDFRKWYGNRYEIIDWHDNGSEVRKEKGASIRNAEWYLKNGISWPDVSSKGTICARTYYGGFMFSNVASMAFAENEDDSYKLLALLNSKVVSFLSKILNPTIHFNPGNVMSLPFAEFPLKLVTLAKRCEEIAKLDWNAHEISWDFVESEFISSVENCKSANFEYVYNIYKNKWNSLFIELLDKENQINSIINNSFEITDSTFSNLRLDEITILQQGEISIENGEIIWHADVIMKQLISYAVGCMMGRYSIDKPGLILANQGDTLKDYNELVPNSRFEADDDGIIPLMASDTDFADNATLRFKQWLTVAFGEETLIQNLNFVEAALGKSLDDYFVKDFWKDHKKMYQNRPIYWQFASKKGAFQCIAYMHRMNPYTAERIRTKYLLPHIEWLITKQKEMEANAATLSTAERRQLDKITKQIAECREYHDRLHLIADQQINFDLDDGVIVNHAKFGDVLTKLK